VTTRRLLVCAPRLPDHDRQSGSRRIFHLIQFACEMGWAVSFVAEEGDDGSDRYRTVLQQMGVATYCGFGSRTHDLIRSGRFDIAICAFWYTAEKCTPRIRELSPATRVIVDSIDLHFVRNMRKCLRLPGETWASGRLDGDFASEMAREINTYTAADAVLTVSEKEASLLNDFIRGLPIAYAIPDSEDLARSNIPYEERRGITFVGNFRHWPNREAAAFLCEEIIPRLDQTLLARHPISIIGNDLTAAVRRYADRLPHVQMVGWVPSIIPYLERARLALVPLRNGAGTKRKLIQALMIGTPAVSTTIGIEGLDLTADEHVLVADDPDAFAAAVDRVVNQATLWNRIAEQGRARIVEFHSADRVRRRFGQVLTEVLRRESRSGAHDSALRQPVLSGPRREYQRIVEDVRQIVERTVPNGATVVVVSKGDEDLLKLGARPAWHFPRNAHGVYAGFYPAGSDAAIAHLEELKRNGAEYLVFPKPALWWLDQYVGFKDYLERHHRIVARDEKTCIIFALTQATLAEDRVLNGAEIHGTV
jgi:glycosyltransferase involved in cell wall biosynthesis